MSRNLKDNIIIVSCVELTLFYPLEYFHVFNSATACLVVLLGALILCGTVKD